MSFSDEDRYPMIFEVAEAGALIQRHLGNGAVYEIIEAGDDFIEANTDRVEDDELADPEHTEAWENLAQAAFLVGVARGLSEVALRNLPPAELRARLQAVA